MAAVAISTLTGEHGILTQTQNAKEKTERAEIIERAQTDILGEQAGNNGDISKEEVNNIIAKYDKEGKIREDKEEAYIITEKGYEIKVSEIWNGTMSSEGKTIAELYDGINNPEDENYAENAMHIGDYVGYTAGTWTETKAAPTSSTPFTFGGYTEGQSKDTNATGSYTYISGGTTYGEGKYEGWRIWDISDDKQTITLISAGCPEVYYHLYGTNYAYNTEKILTGETTGTIDNTKPSTPREWGDYINRNQYATSARAMKKSDLDTWYGKYIDSSITDSWNIDSFPLNTSNKLISTVENGYYYWLSSAGSSSGVYYVNPYDRGVLQHQRLYGGGAYGVRVLVSLTSGVKFKGTPETIVKDGFSYNYWNI